MKFSWLLSILGCVIFFFSSCEKEINIPLVESEAKLVVEGSIATDQQPIVILTKTIGFFDKINLDQVNFVRDADVYVTDLTNSKQVKLTVDSFSGFIFYTVLPTNPMYNDFRNGQFEHSYRLDITYENEDYTSVSKIPNNPNLDTLYFEPESRFQDTLFSLRAEISDPDTLGNYYKYFTRRTGNGWNDATYIEPFSSRFDDGFFNGKTLPADLFIGFDNSDSVDNEFLNEASYSRVGDTISVRLSSMDAQVYKFWKTLDFAEGSIGNPFASPIQVQTNVSNGAFGVWAAYGNRYRTVINKP